MCSSWWVGWKWLWLVRWKQPCLWLVSSWLIHMTTLLPIEVVSTISMGRIVIMHASHWSTRSRFLRTSQNLFISSLWTRVSSYISVSHWPSKSKIVSSWLITGSPSLLNSSCTLYKRECLQRNYQISVSKFKTPLQADTSCYRHDRQVWK